MPSEVYTHWPTAPNGDAVHSGEPRRAGELLPEIFRRYVERMAASARPAAVSRSDKLPACQLTGVATVLGDAAPPFTNQTV